ncbi:MAG: LysM peptidoglycan-binding domain-containing protein [bacterium]
MLALALALTETLLSPAAVAKPANRAEVRTTKLLGRLRPLQMNYRARAHIRGVLPATFRRAMLMQQSDGSLPKRALPPPAPGPRRIGPVVSSPRPPLRPLLRARVGYPLPTWLQGIKLPDIHIRFSPQVYRYLAYYRTNPVGRRVLAHWLGRMNRFRAHISAALRRHGLPQDLIYIAMIESGFRPTTVSWAGATGLWQFMPHGGTIYGLKRTFWLDERYSPDRSTSAAMYYLKDLHARFGNWALALAAYNAGYGSVTRAVRKYNTNDYWRICEYEAGLPYETVRYVPKFFAIAVIARNLDRFEIKPRGVAPAWEYALVTVSGGTPLNQIARLAGIPLKALKELNPELRRSRVPPGQAYEIRLPREALPTYRQRTARSSAGGRKLAVHVVRYGDSIGSIAADYGTSPALLRQINQIRHQREVRPGVKLLVPARRKGQPRKARPDLRPIVGIPSAAAEGADLKAIYYPVVAGDDLPTIARALGVGQASLLVWNNVTASARLLPGMILRAFVPPDRPLSHVRLLDPTAVRVLEVGSVDFHEAHLKQQGSRRIFYRARRGDTLKRVARRFRVSVGGLARENKIHRGAKLTAGQRLVIYTRARRGRSRRWIRRRTKHPRPQPRRRRRGR